MYEVLIVFILQLMQVSVLEQGIMQGWIQFFFRKRLSPVVAQPFESRILLDNSYYFICPKIKSTLPRVVAFRKWLLEEVEKSK